MRHDLDDLDLERISAGAEKVALLGPLVISALPILFPRSTVEAARTQLAQRRASQ